MTYISKNNRKNEWRLSGFVSKTFIKSGQHGPFGMFVLAVDDSYKNPKDGHFVQRTQFIPIDVSKCKRLPEIGVGDYLLLEGKHEVDTWQDKQTQQPRHELKLKLKDIVVHEPASIASFLKEQGFVRPQRQHQNQPVNQPTGNYQRQPQGKPSDDPASTQQGHTRHHNYAPPAAQPSGNYQGQQPSWPQSNHPGAQPSQWNSQPPPMNNQNNGS